MSLRSHTTPASSPRSVTRPGRRARVVHLLRRGLWGRRRLLAAVALGVSVLAGLRAVSPPGPVTEPVVVAVGDQPAGAVLAREALAVVPWPADLVPPGAPTDPETLVGRVLAVPVAGGELLTTARTVTPAADATTPGRVTLPVRLTDPAAAALLRPGDEVDVLATPPQEGAARLVAGRALVVAVAPDDSPGILPGRLVVLSVATGSAGELAAASVREFLTWSSSR